MERSQAAPSSGFSRPLKDSYSPRDYDQYDKSDSKGMVKKMGGPHEKIFEHPLGYDETSDISNLPKTGVEYPFLRNPPVFIKNHDEFEACVPPVPPQVIQEFKRRMEEKPVIPEYSQKVIYDSIEPSPYYNSKDPEDKYLLESDYIPFQKAEYDSKAGTYADVS
jgi:hypothetical protein